MAVAVYRTMEVEICTSFEEGEGGPRVNSR